MRNRVGYMLAAALVTGGVAAFLAYTVLQDSAEATDARSATVEVVDVVVAARNMKAGTVVGSEDIRIIEWPAASVPKGFSRSPSEVVGRGLLSGVKKNEPLLSSRLASKEAGGGLPIVIPPGQRAMSVKVDEVVGVAGFVLPGTRVDVLVTLDQTAGEEEPRTRLLLQNIRVASAGQTTERDAQGEPKSVPVVTLLVDPVQAEKLALASSKGSIRLALRNSLDTDTVSTPGVTADRLIDDPSSSSGRERSRSVYRGPTRYNVDVYRGPEHSTSTVEERTGGGGS